MPKGGNFTICTNYRGISLTQVAAKAYKRMILIKIRPAIDSLLRPTQNAFRPARSTSSHLLGLRIIAEEVLHHKKVALFISIGSKKANAFAKKRCLKFVSYMEFCWRFERYQSYIRELLSNCNDTQRQPLGSMSFCYMP